MNVTFYDILGIDPNDPDRHTTAAARWPDTLASLTPGFNVVHDGADIVQHLQDGLSFKNIRPGVDGQANIGGAPGQISFSANVHVTGSGLLTTKTFYLRSLPDIGIQLLQTDPDPPAQVFFASDSRGFEVVIDRLPVRIFLKRGLASSLGTPPESIGNFAKDKVDGFAYTLQSDALPSEVDCIVRLHILPGGDVVLEPTVPISFGAVRFMGLPAKNVYDVQLISSPNQREYFEWARNDIGSFLSNPPVKGALGFRSIEVDFSQPPFSDLRQRVQNGAIHLENLELVLEDVVVPIFSPMLPIPSHGTFGFRRKITDRTSISQAYDLHGAPVRIPIYGSSAQGGNGGSSLELNIEKFFFATGNPPTIQFQAGLIWQTAAGNTLGATMGIDDEWTFTAGFVMGVQTTPIKFTIADTVVALVGIKFGVSVGRLARQMSFKDSFEILADLAITSKPTGSDSSFFKLRSLTGKDLSIVIHDLGYKLGHFSADGLEFPDGMQLIFANTVRIIIEEMGWVEEPNGTPYFSFSGGVALGFGGGNAVKPSGNPDDNQGTGFGLRVRRLRFRTNDDSSQPLFKIDGIFLNLHFGTVWIEGFGYISDFEADGWAIKEWGFGVKIQFDLLATKFLVAAQFIKGSRRQLSPPNNEFDYFLASLLLGWLPAGPIGLYDIRALVANNMAPNLDSEFPDGEGMALLKWHQEHDGALSMPRSRNLADWVAEKDSFAFGVGCGFSFNGAGNAMKIDVFIFFAKSKADTGLLIVGDLFLLKNPKPIAFVAIEYDFDKDKFGVMVGVDIGLADFAGGSVPSWLSNIARLSGTIYFGNKPWALAIGQLADQRSWLSLNINWNIWITMKVQFGIGLEIVDGGPKGFGFVFTISAGANWGIGSFVLWGTFGFIFGTWKTGSDSSGVEAWLSLGFKINLFFIFSFGADITLRLEYLGKHPWYITLSAEIRIDTPWFLPDVTVRFEKTWQEPLPFDTSTITQSLEQAAGLQTGLDSVSLRIPPLSDLLGDAKHLYTFNELITLSGQLLGDTHLLDIPIVSTDATIVINFTQPVSNDSLIATSTYDGTTDTGVQKVQDLEVRYGLKSIGIRRSPRYGPTAGTWTPLLKSSDTEFSIGGVAPESVTFAWDADTRADGKLAPKRLLLNSSSPYSFVTQSPQNDEEAVSNDADFPCCDGRDQRKTYPKPHVLQFGEITYGSRTPSNERFSGNGAWWHWILPPPPVIAPGDPSYPGFHVARLSPRASGLIGFADSAEPILTSSITLEWDSYPAVLFFEGYDGFQLVAQQKIDLHKAGNGTFVCAVQPMSQGMTRLVLRIEVDKQGVISRQVTAASTVSTMPLASIAILNIIYYDLADYLVYIAGTQRCKNGGKVGPPGSDASGKLAWLPNHDYEVVVTTEVKVSHKATGPRALTLSESFYFRTKGLPGLNACPNPGDDLRLHVENTYPRLRTIPLYREEPTVLSFTEGMSSVLPIDRVPKAGDPPEKAQMFPLLLNIDRIESQAGLKRLTVPSDDWISAHRANPYPIFWVVADSGFAKSKVRQAVSLDPMVLRFEAIRQVFPSCGPQKPEHASQVLLHEPIDQDGNATLWEPQTGYRATVRQKAGPFTERSGFDLFDLGAFIRQADSGAPPFWSMDQTKIVAPPAGVRQYLSCGELTWDHLRVHTSIDLRGASAGLAVGVSNGTPVQQAILATVEPDGGGQALILRKRRGGVDAELGRASVTVKGPLLLTVIAFDDTVRASVGDVVVEGSRGDVREGRVALVANGPAAFAGIGVDALDMFVYDFVTSRYASFQEHIDSYDGNLMALSSGDFGQAPVTIASVLAAHGAEIAPLMQAAADPQERQKLFASVIATLGIGLHKNPGQVKLSRLSDVAGTYGLLLESPEPISFTRDVSVTLVWHTRKWVGGIVFDPPVVISPAVPIATLPPLPGPPIDPVVDPSVIGSALSTVRFESGFASMPRNSAKFEKSDLLVRAVDTPQGTMLHVFDAPQVVANAVNSQGKLREIIPLAQAARRADLRAAANLAPNAVAVIHEGGILGTIWGGHWEPLDVTMPLTVLTNGDETVALLISQNGSPLNTGNYTLQFTLDRDRWRASGALDPEQHYHQTRSINIHW